MFWALPGRDLLWLTFLAGEQWRTCLPWRPGILPCDCSDVFHHLSLCWFWLFEAVTLETSQRGLMRTTSPEFLHVYTYLWLLYLTVICCVEVVRIKMEPFVLKTLTTRAGAGREERILMHTCLTTRTVTGLQKPQLCTKTIATLLTQNPSSRTSTQQLPVCPVLRHPCYGSFQNSHVILLIFLQIVLPLSSSTSMNMHLVFYGRHIPIAMLILKQT